MIKKGQPARPSDKFPAAKIEYIYSKPPNIPATFFEKVTNSLSLEPEAGGGAIDADDDAQGAGHAVAAQRLVQDERRGHGRKDGRQVDVGRHGQRAQFADGLVPGQIAEHGGHHAQKQQVAPHGGPRQRLGRVMQGLVEKVRQNGQQAVAEDLAREEQRAVAPLHVFEPQCVKSPAERGGQAEQVALGRELEDEAAVENDERHAAQRQHGAEDEGRLERLFQRAGEKADKDGREQRRRAEDERHLRGERVVERGVLGQEVERAAAQAEPNGLEFVAEVVGPAFLSAGHPQHQDIRQQKAVEEDGGRVEAVEQQHLGGDERRPPYADGQDGDEMEEGFAAKYHLNFSSFFMSASVMLANSITSASWNPFESNLFANSTFSLRIISVLSFFLWRVIECFNLPMTKLNSREDWVSVVSSSGIIKSASMSPIRFIPIFFSSCESASWTSNKRCLSSLTSAKVFIIANVVCVAIGLFNMVANIYRPFSVNAFGKYFG